jgi:hypothetical protein
MNFGFVLKLSSKRMLWSEIHLGNKGSERRSEAGSRHGVLPDFVSCDDVEIIVTPFPILSRWMLSVPVAGEP